DVDRRQDAAALLAPPRLRRDDGAQRPFQLRRVRDHEAGIGGEGLVDRHQPALATHDELDLELDEPSHDAAAGDGVDLVEAELDGGAIRLEQALPAKLTDPDDLDERRIAALLEDQ